MAHNKQDDYSSEIWTKRDELELEYLRYFYDSVEGSLGPASDDIYKAIADDYVSEGNVLPDTYTVGAND